MNSRPLPLRLAVVASGLGVLVACGSESPSPPSTVPSAQFTASPPVMTDPAGAGAASDLVDSRCDSVNGVWSMTGSLSNPGRDPAVYTVVALVAAREGGGMRGRAQTTVEVRPGERTPVSLQEIVRDPDPGVHCVISTRRASR